MDHSKRPRENNHNLGPNVRLPNTYRNNSNPTSLQQDTFSFASETSQSEASVVRGRVNTILKGTNDGSIPSPLPGTLARRDLTKFLRVSNRYRVCEKSDGDRALMYVSKDGCYLINRKFQIQKVNNDQFDLYTNLVKDGDELLLDGEIITNYFDPTTDKFESPEEQQTRFHPAALAQDVKIAGNVDTYLAQRVPQQRSVYCMFDVAFFDKTDLQEEPLDTRLSHCGKLKQRLREYLIPILKQKWGNEQGEGANKIEFKSDEDYYQHYIWKHAPLRIETKDFQYAADMRRIIGTVIKFPAGEGYLYYNHRKQLKAKNDGFIFTPIDNNYMMSANPDQYVYKYKWPGLNTVDFHIVAPFFDEKGQLVLYSHGYDGSGTATRKVDFEFSRIGLSQENKEYVLTNVEKVERAVVECNYEVLKGKWVVKHLRTDKHKGNFFSTVLSCVEAMIDNLQPQELEQMLRKVGQ
jgi:hypothetical protein